MENKFNTVIEMLEKDESLKDFIQEEESYIAHSNDKEILDILNEQHASAENISSADSFINYKHQASSYTLENYISAFLQTTGLEKFSIKDIKKQSSNMGEILIDVINASTNESGDVEEIVSSMGIPFQYTTNEDGMIDNIHINKEQVIKDAGIKLYQIKTEEIEAKVSASTKDYAYKLLASTLFNQFEHLSDVLIDGRYFKSIEKLAEYIKVASEIKELPQKFILDLKDTDDEDVADMIENMKDEESHIHSLFNAENAKEFQSSRNINFMFDKITPEHVSEVQNSVIDAITDILKDAAKYDSQKTELSMNLHINSCKQASVKLDNNIYTVPITIEDSSGFKFETLASVYISENKTEIDKIDVNLEPVLAYYDFKQYEVDLGEVKGKTIASSPTAAAMKVLESVHAKEPIKYNGKILEDRDFSFVASKLVANEFVNILRGFDINESLKIRDLRPKYSKDSAAPWKVVSTEDGLQLEGIEEYFDESFENMEV